jgi:beta-1,4-mannosyl-glycoprotein beta-1,4-N-acetylglucosaminyltransferase
MALIRRQRFLLAFVFVFIFLFSTVVFYYIFRNQYQIQNTISYISRPLWDHNEAPSEVLPHFYSEGMIMDQHTCGLHGWKRRGGVDVKVLDAMLMSTELDLLEIRLNELDHVVDFFFIVESNATFTGLPKETYFEKNKARFSKFQHKIVYELYGPSILE